MKALIVLSACLLIGVLANVVPDPRERARQIKAECKQQAGATDDEVKELKDKDELTSPAAKKMMACVFTRNQIMQNNKFSKEGSVQLARDLLKDRAGSETKIKIAEQIADNCAAEIGSVKTTAEEMAKLIFDCLKKQAKEYRAAMAQVPNQDLSQD